MFAQFLLQRVVAGSLDPSGNWLSREQAVRFVNPADPTHFTDVSLAVLADVVQGPGHWDAFFHHLGTSARRVLLSEPIALVSWYCEHTNQMEHLRSQPWHSVATLLAEVATTGRGGDLTSWPAAFAAKGIKEVHWHRVHILESMVGQRLQVSDVDAIDLAQALLAFTDVLE